MSQLFQTYQQDFIKSLATTQRKLQPLLAQASIKQQAAFTQIKLDLTQTQKCLKYMQTQAGSLPPHIRPKFQQKVSKYKREYNEIRRKITKKQDEYNDERNRQVLMAGRIEDTQSAKEKLIAEGQLMSDATYKLKESVGVMRVTEGISNDVQIELVNHTDRLTRNKEKLGAIDEDLTESQKLLTKISAVIRRNKLVLGVVLGLVILAIIVITSMLIIKKNKANNAANTTTK